MIIKSRFCTVAAAFLALVIIMTGGCASSGAKSVDVFWDTALMQNVTRLTDDGLQKAYAKISPDGTKMLYCEMAKNDSQYKIMLLRDVTVPAKTPLINDSAYTPAWYGNNINFVYIADEKAGTRIIRSAITGGGKTYITRNDIGLTEECPSVRGEAVLFDTLVDPNAYPGPKYQIYSMRDNGTELTMLGDGRFPSWHPTQAKFVFIREGNIYEMDIASVQVTQLFSDVDYNCAFPSYSSDGQYILFQKGAEKKVTGTAVSKVGGFLEKVTKITSTQTKWQLFTIMADGTSLSPLTFGEVNAFHPSWGADNFVYFVSDASGKTELYRARINLN
jgi:Tol biopolymer transport system component